MYSEEGHSTDVWWSDKIIRSDVWVELKSDRNDMRWTVDKPATAQQALLTFVSAIANTWCACARGEAGAGAAAQRIDTLFEQLLQEFPACLEAMNIGALHFSCAFAVRRETCCVVLCDAVWHELIDKGIPLPVVATDPTTDPVTTTPDELFRQLMASLTIQRWKRWALGVDDGVSITRGSEEPRSALLFLGVISQALGLLSTTEQPPSDVRATLVKLAAHFPVLFEVIAEHTASLASRLNVALLRTTRVEHGDHDRALLDAVTSLVSLLTTDAIVFESTIGCCSAKVRAFVQVVVAHLRELFETMLGIALGTSGPAAGSSSSLGGTDDDGAAAAATHKALCHAIQRIHATANRYDAMVPKHPVHNIRGAAVDGACVPSQRIADIFVAAALEDAALLPTSKTLSRLLLQRGVAKSAMAPLTVDVVSKAFSALLFPQSKQSSGKAAEEENDRQLLVALLHESPVLWFRDFFAACSAPRSRSPFTINYNACNFVRDEDGAAFSLNIRREASASSCSSDGQSPPVIVTDTDAFATLYFGRNWQCYCAAEEFFADVLGIRTTTTTTNTALLKQRMQRVLGEAGRIALEFHAQQTGSPVALEHVELLWWLEMCRLHKLHTRASPGSTPQSISERFPIMSSVAEWSLHSMDQALGSSRGEDDMNLPPAGIGGEKEASEAAMGSVVTADRQPSLRLLHRCICHSGASNVFAFFLPVLRSLGVDYTGLKDLDESLAVVAPEAMLHSASTLFTHRRPVLFFLQPSVLSKEGGSYISPAVEPSIHASHFLLSIWSQDVSRQLFVDIVAEAAILLGLRALRVDSIVKNVAMSDLDCAAALFFGVLRLIQCSPALIGRQNGGADSALPRLCTLVLSDLESRLATVPIPGALSAEKKKFVRRYVSGCFSMATGFILQPPTPPPEVQVPSALADAEEVEAEEKQEGVEALVVPVANALEEPLPQGGVPQTDNGSAVTLTCAEPNCEADQVDPNCAVALQHEGAEPLLSAELISIPQPSAAVSTPSSGQAQPAVPDRPPQSEEQPMPPPAPAYHPPSTSSNLWIQWFWSVRFVDIVNPAAASEARKQLLRSVGKLKLPAQKVNQLRNLVRDELPELERVSAACVSTHRAVLARILSPAAAADKMPLLRPLMNQWMHELTLRAAVSFPDAHVSISVLRQLLTLLASGTATSGVGSAAAAEPVPQVQPEVVCDLLRILVRAISGQLLHASVPATRCLAYFLSEFVVSIIFPWRRSSLSAGKGRQGTVTSSAPNFDAVLPRGRDVDILKDVYMETMRSIESLLSDNTTHGDLAAYTIKHECRAWLGLYETTASRIREAEKGREDAVRGSSEKEMLDGHPIMRMVKDSWIFPDDQPHPARVLYQLFQVTRKRDRSVETRHHRSDRPREHSRERTPPSSSTKRRDDKSGGIMTSRSLATDKGHSKRGEDYRRDRRDDRGGDSKDYRGDRRESKYERRRARSEDRDERRDDRSHKRGHGGKRRY